MCEIESDYMIKMVYRYMDDIIRCLWNESDYMVKLLYRDMDYITVVVIY